MKFVYALALLQLAAFAAAAPFDGTNVGDCPTFTCGSKNPFRGYWGDQTEYYDDGAQEMGFPEAPGSRFSISLGDSSVPDFDGTLQSALDTCYGMCVNYAKNNKGYNVLYWQYEVTCEDNGGICSCYQKPACEGKNFVSEDHRTDPTGVGSGDTSYFYSGSLCDSDITGDPHFSGADGSRFDFTGEPNRAYSLFSDAHLQVNAFLGGRVDKWGDSAKALTWIRQVAVLFGHHSVSLKAREGPSAHYEDGYVTEILVDGRKVLLAAPGERLTLLDDAVSITWLAAKKRSGDDFVDEFEVAVKDVVTIRLTARPEVANLRTAEDGVVHFSVDVVDAKLSSNVHGVLGQTYRPDFVGRLAKQTLVYSDLLKTMVVPGDNAEGFIDGEVSHYEVSDILRADCKVCRFVRASDLDEETAAAVSMTSATSTYSLPRRMGGFIATV